MQRGAPPQGAHLLAAWARPTFRPLPSGTASGGPQGLQEGLPLSPVPGTAGSHETRPQPSAGRGMEPTPAVAGPRPSGGAPPCAGRALSGTGFEEELARHAKRTERRCSRFNEAAAVRLRKRAPTAGRPTWHGCFNEAAAVRLRKRAYLQAAEPAGPRRLLASAPVGNAKSRRCALDPRFTMSNSVFSITNYPFTTLEGYESPTKTLRPPCEAPTLRPPLYPRRDLRRARPGGVTVPISRLGRPFLVSVWLAGRTVDRTLGGSVP